MGVAERKLVRAPPRWPAADAQVVLIFRELKMTTETTSASTSQFACSLTRNPWAMNAGTSCRRGFKLIPIDPAQRDLFTIWGQQRENLAEVLVQPPILARESVDSSEPCFMVSPPVVKSPNRRSNF